MLRFFLLCLSFTTILMGYSSNPINAYAVSVYDEHMTEENIQGKQKTSNDYSGIVYTKIYAFGTFLEENVYVRIGNSRGSEIKRVPIVKNHIQIGYELIYKHTTVQNGYLEVYIGKKLYDRSLYVK